MDFIIFLVHLFAVMALPIVVKPHIMMKACNIVKILHYGVRKLCNVMSDPDFWLFQIISSHMFWPFLLIWMSWTPGWMSGERTLEERWSALQLRSVVQLLPCFLKCITKPHSDSISLQLCSRLREKISHPCERVKCPSLLCCNINTYTWSGVKWLMQRIADYLTSATIYLADLYTLTQHITYTKLSRAPAGLEPNISNP